MSRKLLFPGVFLGFIAVLACLLILFLTDETEQNLNSYSNFQIALQINLFHGLLLMILSAIKRRYTDQSLITAGWLLAFSTLLLAIPAYLGVFAEIGEMLFDTLGIFGGLGLVIGWLILIKSFYDSYIAKEH